MKHSIFNAILIIGFCLLLSSCNKIDTSNSQINKLIGTWEWVYTIGGDTYNISTPTSEGYTKQLEFKENGVYKTYKNGKQTLRSKYKINITTEDSTNVYVIEYKDKMFDNFPEPFSTEFRFEGDDTLLLEPTRGCSDCEGHMYVKK